MKIDGITLQKQSNYAIIHITSFSNQLKELLREQLSCICYGVSNSKSKRKIYSYRRTLKELLKRYETKPDKTRKGMIGELLIHVVIHSFFKELSVVSPFFNIEERNIKKGFDVVLASNSDYSVWFTEVKSGELRKGKNSNETNFALINNAKSDICEKLNGEFESTWLNAINGAKIVLEKHHDIKEAVEEILCDYADEASVNELSSNECNVFLASTLFASLDDSISETNIKSKTNEIITENSFNEVFLLSVQKETYQKIHKFLKDESENG